MTRLRRKHIVPERHAEFSPVLFDVLFGLLIFLGINGLFNVHGTLAFFFSVISLVLVLHWWLKYKAADDTYGPDVGNSTADMLFGVIEVVLLQLAMIAAGRGEYINAVFYFTLPLMTESIWALLWFFFGKWRRTSLARTRYMEQQLEHVLFLNLAAAAALGGLVTNAPLLSDVGFVIGFIAISAMYIGCTVWLELIDLRIL